MTEIQGRCIWMLGAKDFEHIEMYYCSLAFNSFLLVGSSASHCVGLEGKKNLASLFLSLCWLRCNCINQAHQLDTSFPGLWLWMERLNLLGQVRTFIEVVVVFKCRSVPVMVFEMDYSFRMPWLYIWTSSFPWFLLIFWAWFSSLPKCFLIRPRFWK